MSAMCEVPKQPYGYLPPKLGGDLELPRVENEQRFTDGKWVVQCSPTCCRERIAQEYYTRPIDVGPEWELAEENTQTSGECEMTHDGVTWLKMAEFGDRNQTPSYWNTVAECEPGNRKPILAIRRRRKTVKDEWPKYFEPITPAEALAITNPEKVNPQHPMKYKYFTNLKTNQLYRVEVETGVTFLLVGAKWEITSITIVTDKCEWVKEVEV